MTRIFLFFIGISITLFSFSQKKREVIIPQTQKDSLSLEGLLIEAEKQLILENYSTAFKIFKKGLKLNTQSATIHFKIAEVLVKNGERQESLPFSLKAIELDPQNKYYRLNLAKTYQSIGFYIDAAKTYEELVEKFPSESDVLYDLAELYQLMGQKKELFRIFDKIEILLGVKEEIVRKKQQIYIQEGQISKVIAEYEKLIEAYPNEFSYKTELIIFLIQQKKLKEAEKKIAIYEKKTYVSSQMSLIKSELAWTKGNIDTSLQLLSIAFKTNAIDFQAKFQIISNYFLSNPNTETRDKLTKIAQQLADMYTEEFKIQAFVGDLFFQKKEKQKAVTYYLKAVKLSPSNYLVWKNILNIEASLNQYDSLVIHAEKALEYFPNQALLYYFAGTGYLTQANYKKTVRMLEQGKKYTRDPNLLTVFYGQLGDAYNALKEDEKAYQAYEMALKNNPYNYHVLNNYSYFLALANKDIQKSLKMATLLIKQYPENPTYLDTYGWVLYTNGDYKEAKKILEKAIFIDKDGTVVEHYGDVLFQLGEVENAIKQWKEALRLGNTSDFIEKKIVEQKLYE